MQKEFCYKKELTNVECLKYSSILSVNEIYMHKKPRHMHCFIAHVIYDYDRSLKRIPVTRKFEEIMYQPTSSYVHGKRNSLYSPFK